MLWLDIDRVFHEESANGLVGLNFFVDFIHPNIAGHQLIAREVALELRAAAVPVPAAEWKPFPVLPSPDEVLEAQPELRALELKSGIVGRLISLQQAEAEQALAELKEIAPEDPELTRLSQWVAGGLPF